MGVIIKLFIGGFIFGIFGSFINDIIYYVLFSWNYFFNILFFLFNLFGLSSTGYFVLNLIYIMFPLSLIYFIVHRFVPHT